MAGSDDGTGDIAVEEAHRRAQSREIVLVDVRRPDEWAATGVGAPAQTVTMHQDAQAFLAEFAGVAGAPGESPRPIALICATGRRTLQLKPFLEQAGYRDVLNVVGGMKGTEEARGWLECGLPVRPWPAGDGDGAGE